LVLSKLSVSEWPQGIPLKKWVLTLLFLSYFVLIGATVQQREARCFNELVAENEHVYHLAWHGSKADHVVIQREFVPYLDKMFGHVARIRGISPSEMPRVHEPHLHEPRVGVPANSNVNVWGYSPRSCGLDVLP
jgi:hypothetical protein